MFQDVMPSQYFKQVLICSKTGSESLVSAAQRLAQATSAQRVFLFGSVAGGTFDGFGDIDFCYIVSNGTDLVSTQRKAQEAFADRITPLDFIGMHEGVFNSGSRLLAREIHKNGKLLYSAHEN
jgi:predicted nucleotidyltransferase